MKALQCKTTCGMPCWYLGTTAARTVWVVYRESDVAEVWSSFAKLVKRGGMASRVQELAAMKRNGLVLECTAEEFARNRSARVRELVEVGALP